MTSLRIGAGGLKTTNIGTTSRTTWTKPSDWPDLPTVTSADNKFVGLYAVYPNQENFIAITASANGGLAGYTVDWGDGNIENFSAGATSYHKYDYNDPDITVTSSRGYKIVTVIVTPTGGNPFYTLNLLVKHNQTSLNSFYTTGWLDIAFSGTAFGSNNLTIGGSNPVQHRILERVRIYSFTGYTGGGLFNSCISLKSVSMPAITSGLTSTAAMFFNCFSLSSVPLFDTSNVTSMSGMFNGCTSLQSVPAFNTNKVTDMTNMFNSCWSLQSIPDMNTANVTTMASTFAGCRSIRTVPKFNTANVTSFSSMFAECSSLQTVPYFNTSKVTTMYRMFYGTYSGVPILTVPPFDTANVTSMAGMFYNCSSLTSVPAFNTSKVTDMSNMFSMFYEANGGLETIPQFDTANVTTFNSMFRTCYGLQTIPLIDTSKATDVAGMFQSCASLRTIPEINTSNVRTMDSMFYACYALQSVPTLNTSNCQVFSTMFRDCNSLTSIPTLNVSNTTASANFTNMFTNCYGLANIAASQFKYTFSVSNCRLSNTDLNFIFTNLPTVSSQTITITSNYGANTCNTTIATSKGWTVTN